MLAPLARAVALASAPLLAAASLTARILPQEFADSFGAKCLDGTPPAIYFKLGAPGAPYILFL